MGVGMRWKGIEYSVRENHRARRVILRVFPPCRLEVVVPRRFNRRRLPEIFQTHRDWIQRELQDAISKGEGGKDAPVLMAYLGYQANSRQIVRYGLALAQTKSPRDPLLTVLREIWLDGSDTPSADRE